MGGNPLYEGRNNRSHPIGIIMCALTEVEKKGVKGKWEFVKYDQSSHVEHVSDSSVSYVSAYWAPSPWLAIKPQKASIAIESISIEVLLKNVLLVRLYWQTTLQSINY